MYGCEPALRNTLPEMFDVCVIGAGPAGSALASRLVRLGRGVALVEKANFPRTHVGESLTGGVLPLLDSLGVITQMEAEEFLCAPKATVLWADRLNHRDTHGGYQVDRGAFDALLLRAARKAGVVVMQPARVIDKSFSQHWSIQLDTGEVLRARFLADAAGRSRFLGGAKTAFGAPTIAIYGYWTNVDVEDGNTLVEAGT